MTRPDVLGLEALPLALGTNTFGWTADEATAFRILDAFHDAGGRLVDTADNYSIWAEGNDGSESETIIGRWLAASGRRDDMVVATKVSRHPDFRGLSRASILGGVEVSLRRLQTDRIDVYYAHYDDPGTPVEESVAAFQELREAGKIRHVGLSNYGGARLAEWIRVSREHGWEPPVSLQPHYNLVHRQPYERELAPIVAAENLAVIPYFGLASGFLSGKFRTADDVERSDRKIFTAQYLSPESQAVLDVLDTASRELGIPVPTIALAWLRSRPFVAAPLVSARAVAQLPDLLAAATTELGVDVLARLDAVSARVDLP